MPPGYVAVPYTEIELPELACPLCGECMHPVRKPWRWRCLADRMTWRPDDIGEFKRAVAGRELARQAQVAYG